LLPQKNFHAQTPTMTQQDPPLLIVFSGLPGTGKTTISQALADKLHAVYLRIDTIEQAMKSAGAEQIGPAGYVIANELAATNLQLGHSIVADCVNPVSASRLGWRNVATRAQARLIEIHLICSDASEHKRRVEFRIADIPGHRVPNWEDVNRHEFEPRDDDYLLLDTAFLQPAALVDRCATYISDRRRR
jgi:predicted kinase